MRQGSRGGSSRRLFEWLKLPAGLAKTGRNQSLQQAARLDPEVLIH